MSNSTELTSTTENGYTPFVDLDDIEEFDHGEVPPNTHPIKRCFHRGMLHPPVMTHDLTRKLFFSL